MKDLIDSDLGPGRQDQIRSSPLYNEDLAPIPSGARRWKLWDIAALWVGMSVCIPTYMLSSGLISQGMNWWQAIITVSLGNLIVFVPMVLNGHAGTKYGITFPVFARASFGTKGTHVASILRAIVACGWFGIQTWIGGFAIYKLALLAWPGLAETEMIGFLSSEHIQVNLAQVFCFLIFWSVNVGLFWWRGMESIRFVEDWGAPLLLLLGLGLLYWAYRKADGFGPMLSQPDRFETRADFWRAFFPGLTAMVGFWATLSLNIPDFTREAKTQRDQILGQFFGLNVTMPLYSFIGVAVTSATVVIFGETIWDPVELLSRFDSIPLMVISMFALTLATLTTNMAANVVAPATAFSNCMPKTISLRGGAIITGIIGILMMPWKLIADPSGYIFTWLIGYSALLGPIGGIVICDYFVIRRTRLKLDALYLEEGAYRYRKGFNPVALAALVAGIAPNVPGFLNTIGVVKTGLFWSNLYFYAWFIGFAISFAVYYLLSRVFKTDNAREAAE